MVQGLGERLKEQRQLNKISPKEVSNTVGISISVISNYERGERTPSVENLMALAALYHCSVDYLLGIEKSNNVGIDTSMLNNKQIALLQSFLKSLKN